MKNWFFCFRWLGRTDLDEKQAEQWWVNCECDGSCAIKEIFLKRSAGWCFAMTAAFHFSIQTVRYNWLHSYSAHKSLQVLANEDQERIEKTGQSCAQIFRTDGTFNLRQLESGWSLELYSVNITTKLWGYFIMIFPSDKWKGIMLLFLFVRAHWWEVDGRRRPFPD